MKQPELKTWQSLSLGILIGSVIMAAALLISLPDRKTPLTMLPTSTPAKLVVHISGGVNQEGVIEIHQKSRIKDAIQAAGGLNSEADVTQINLAAYVVDGQKIQIPVQGEKIHLDTTSVSKSIPDEIGLISINTASQKELEKLPGIGEEKAKAIINERETRGKFLTFDELASIPGITSKIIEQIRPYLVFD